MKRRWKLAIGSAASMLLAGLAVFATQAPAAAHGAMELPGSRTFLCYEDGLTATGQIIPNNPACAAAVAQGGTTPLYNWFAVLRSDGAGRTSGFVPDGKLCSGNATVYDFSGFDLPRNDWPVTHLTAGATMQIKYNKWAAHPGTFSLYVTKQGWNDTQPLAWSEMQSTPFSSATDPPSIGDPGSVSSYYYWNATLPTGLTGHHIIYSVWSRSDSTETFYGCSDVDFDGGNGNVTGLGPGSGGGTGGTPPPETSCTATYQTTGSWNGGFQAQVTVSNPSSSPLNGWHVDWSMPDGETVASLWNGTYTTAGSLVTVTNASWNAQLPAAGTTTFGYVANYTGTPAAPTLSCDSP
jgi:predicted carbohydrate-binding protein with CBM5 and CBM33 domain